MLLTLIRKEVHQNILSFRFVIGAVITLTLVALASFIASQDYNLRLGTYQAKVTERQNQLRQVQVYSRLQPTITRPPEPLSILDQGYDARLGTDVNINIYEVPFEAVGENRGNEFMSEFRGLDVTSIVIVVLGLLALLMTFDAVIGEKEDGTLKLIMSNQISRTTLLLGKYLGGLTTLCLPLFISLIVGLLIILFHAQIRLSGSDWLRIGGVFASYMVYLSVMLLVGMLISMLARRSSVSLMLCVFFWLVAVFILPNAATSFASDVIGIKTSQQTINSQVAELTREREQLVERTRDPFLDKFTGYSPGLNNRGLRGAVLHRYGHPIYYDTAAKYYAYDAEQGMVYAQRVFNVRKQYDSQLTQAGEVEAGISYISPAYLLKRVAESFAGTSVEDYDRFLNYCQSYRDQFITYLQSKDAFNAWRWFTDDPPDVKPVVAYLGFKPEDVTEENAEKIFAAVTPELREQFEKRMAEDERDPARLLSLGEVPQSRYRSPRVSEIISRSMTPLGVFLALNAIVFAACFVVFLRYDLR